MKHHINLTVAACCAIMMTSCVPVPQQVKSDARVEYLESSYPQLKNLRDQMMFQLNTGAANINHLTKLRDSFTQASSKQMVNDKIAVVKQQQNQLMEQLKRIDAEAERGIALKEFNVIDGGGERKDEINDLTKESENRVKSANKLNNNISSMYGYSNGGAPHISIETSSVTFYEYYPLLPAVNRFKLDQAFSKHPELFDPKTKVGQSFIKLIKNLKNNNKHFFDDPNWIDDAVKACIH